MFGPTWGNHWCCNQSWIPLILSPSVKIILCSPAKTRTWNNLIKKDRETKQEIRTHNVCITPVHETTEAKDHSLSKILTKLPKRVKMMTRWKSLQSTINHIQPTKQQRQHDQWRHCDPPVYKDNSVYQIFKPKPNKLSKRKQTWCYSTRLSPQATAATQSQELASRAAETCCQQQRCGRASPLPARRLNRRWRCC